MHLTPVDYFINSKRMEEDFPKTLLELEDRFGTEDACREYLLQLR